MGPYFYPIRCGARRVRMAGVRVLGGLLLLAIGAAGAVAADRLLIAPAASSSGETPPIERTEPGPTDPPIVWIAGELQEVSESELLVREGEGPTVTVERFAGDATRFYRPDAGIWRQLEGAEIDATAPGEEACIEALADGEAFLAIRVFLERGCAPA